MFRSLFLWTLSNDQLKNIYPTDKLDKRHRNNDQNVIFMIIEIWNDNCGILFNKILILEILKFTLYLIY